jgi:hypothetical protein
VRERETNTHTKSVRERNTHRYRQERETDRERKKERHIIEANLTDKRNDLRAIKADYEMSDDAATKISAKIKKKSFLIFFRKRPTLKKIIFDATICRIQTKFIIVTSSFKDTANFKTI